ncbi:MAG: DUF2383 domain-containing protein [Pseudomonadota bacterium]
MSLDTTEEFRNDLAKLQVRITDTLAGYDEILKEAEPEIEPLMQRFTQAHQQHEAELSERLRSHGCAPDTDGSSFSLVQRAVIKTRAVFDDMDDDILHAVVRGEERIVRLYDDALNTAQTAEDTALLQMQREQVTDLLDEARRLSD